ncbi:gamma-glutamyl-gamma-aminobutyrate hydrolase family protein [Sulfuriferula nivalis]|uniref:gamma-glutamyl-gamma-aminobutyrate hydrolase n=1 Tax=Sulfuriferula nivalis TaxID=2675298 RepID=A0A809RFG0_9PROT|nr:gamma-glutamyl-gamma-aminobutyrate hydrolase family protein [Sulfuriferula nivalis]BBO99613.1 glutamine amidotransferase [Sulfuriferula nivalis]
MMQNRTPVVLLPADSRQLGDHPFHVAGHKYVKAVVQAAHALPLIVPALGSESDIAALLEVADGILLPGAVSNVHPSHFDQDVRDPSLPLDPARDGLTLRLIRAAVDARVPVLGICRGFQEINVAFGGSLHQAVHETAGMADHREPDTPELEQQYAQVHTVRTVAGGQLAAMTGSSEFMVNSLHGQGIDRLGAGLVAEAYAPDGLIEAVSVAGAKTFALAVQWHPEWDVLNTPAYLAIFRAFGAACQARVVKRN